MIGGDFNIVLNMVEKNNGAIIVNLQVQDFQNCIESYDLTQGLYKGEPF